MLKNQQDDHHVVLVTAHPLNLLLMGPVFMAAQSFVSTFFLSDLPRCVEKCSQVVLEVKLQASKRTDSYRELSASKEFQQLPI